MKRNDWAVPYTGEQLKVAAQAKKEFHDSRAKWWQEKKDEVIAKIRTSGLSVTESIVDELAKTGYPTSNAAGGPVVQIDLGMQAQLREAHEKVHSHKSKVVAYDAWVQMLSAHPARVFDVACDDWMYFFGK